MTLDKFCYYWACCTFALQVLNVVYQIGRDKSAVPIVGFVLGLPVYLIVFGWVK